ncbi:16S rRNA (guanine(527)-N(7))-methyltransferase RsmG [Microlunatus panaciterrae]|uniref:Ribosomal RNA small subunit methyltransferase G n=1 Tax=Microlunatus panaciterrae TaxID=400768 RepID=A0ABS2RIV2_9ACTN|nr:16S rRNA (guanine527-N7)-methyltransferase [Microlunatus panaciterrae]
MTAEIAEEVFGEHFETISRYVDILSSRGIEWGLIGPREVDKLWDRHILNSTAFSGLITPGATVVDVGSGAGLPGIPLAVLRPDLQVTLLEPLLRRCNFLSQAVDELGITSRVSVVRARAEDHDATYEVVTARALAPLGRLIEWCAALMEPHGVLLALKGRSAAGEVAAAAADLARRRLTADILTVRAHPRAESTTVVRVA